MYLPLDIPAAKVMISVKTYPNPSTKYDELVCTAGFVQTDSGHHRWIRVYPVRFRSLPYQQQFRKYDWIQVNLTRRQQDARRESYMPKLGIDEPIKTLASVGTGKDRQWTERKRYVLQDVELNMKDLIARAKDPSICQSLATIKPKEVVDFSIQEVDRRWDPRFQADLEQQNLFQTVDVRYQRSIEVVKKLPYRYYYHFITEGDDKPRKMMIEDWEIGALYWNCLRDSGGDEEAANLQVRAKYVNQILQKDVYFFVGTTLANHFRGPNPFVIIGVFWPPYNAQMALPFDY